MSPSIEFSESQSHNSLAEACKLAWHTFYGMQKTSEDFENLRFEVWTIAICLDSLHSIGSTSLLIDRQPDNKRWALTYSKILTSLNAALRPLYNLVKLYLSTSTRDRTTVKQWLTNQDIVYRGVTIQDFRRKLSLLVESLNVFLSSLTHAELTRARAVTETEEYQVLSELTKNVLQKGDQGRGTGTSQEPQREAKSIQPIGYVNDNFDENIASPLNGVFSSSSSEGPHSPLWPSQRRHKHHTSLDHPAEILNLDGIETGFRRHVHAMRRIREQLWQQNENTDHLANQRSTHFPEPIPSPTILLTPTMPDSSQLSEVSLEYADTSSTGKSFIQSSQSPSAFQDEVPRSPSVPATANHARALSGDSRRNRVHSHDDLQPGRTNEHMDGFARDRKPGKTALEQMLSAALFFDRRYQAEKGLRMHEWEKEKVGSACL